MLIDVHAHFLTELSGRADWREINLARLEAGDRIGVTCHVASILGTWGARSPTYFPSPEDVSHANERMLELAAEYPDKLFGYCVVNPNYPEHALSELEQRIGEGMIGIKLAASRRADDPLLDAIADFAAAQKVPILHHVWQHRQHDWPGQEASDALELSALASRHADVRFVLAHIGGGGDWAHSLRAIHSVSNVSVDLSGSGVDSGMIEATLEAVGPQRILWGTDLTMDTGLAKLRYLESLNLPEADLAHIKYGNAAEIFPRNVFDRDN